MIFINYLTLLFSVVSLAIALGVFARTKKEIGELIRKLAFVTQWVDAINKTVVTITSEITANQGNVVQRFTGLNVQLKETIVTFARQYGLINDNGHNMNVKETLKAFESAINDNAKAASKALAASKRRSGPRKALKK